MKRLTLLGGGAILLALLSFTSFWLTKQTRPATPQRESASDKSFSEFYTEGQRLAQTRVTEIQDKSVTFLAVGDISLSRSVASAIKTHQNPLYPYKNIEQLLTSTDFNFGNLESPFSSRDTFNPGPSLVFNAPKQNVIGLKKYNFAVLNLANNHALDQGTDGVLTTARVLDENGILHMGTGKSLDEAWRPAVIEKNGIKIGFIGASYASVNDGGKTTNNYVARIEDLDRLTTQVAQLKSSVDFIVVTMHAGTEYTSTANDAQITFARAAVDAGADMVIGAHPHWIQNKELYCPKSKPVTQEGLSGFSPTASEAPSGVVSNQSDNPRPDCKWIYYSLGNFIFDQSWSEQTKKGLALKITISKPNVSQLQGPRASSTVSVQEIPIYIKENCCPTEDDGNKK